MLTEFEVYRDSETFDEFTTFIDSKFNNTRLQELNEVHYKYKDVVTFLIENSDLLPEQINSESLEYFGITQREFTDRIQHSDVFDTVGYINILEFELMYVHKIREILHTSITSNTELYKLYSELGVTRRNISTIVDIARETLVSKLSSHKVSLLKNPQTSHEKVDKIENEIDDAKSYKEYQVILSYINIVLETLKNSMRLLSQ